MGWLDDSANKYGRVLKQGFDIRVLYAVFAILGAVACVSIKILWLPSELSQPGRRIRIINEFHSYVVAIT